MVTNALKESILLRDYNYIKRLGDLETENAKTMRLKIFYDSYILSLDVSNAKNKDEGFYTYITWSCEGYLYSLRAEELVTICRALVDQVVSYD